jgi:hypothetical protein
VPVELATARMNTECRDCHQKYDDADRSTICPHPLLMPRKDLEQKKLGLSLLGRPVRFAHMPGNAPMRVQSVNWNGMVTVEGMVGEFAPHLFVPEKETASQ